MVDVYILRCADGALYIGVSEDLASRIARHNQGRGCRFTSVRRPVTLVYSESLPARKEAMARERQIKRWTRAKKEALIAGDIDLLHRR
jgi:putative endonuclease